MKAMKKWIVCVCRLSVVALMSTMLVGTAWAQRPSDKLDRGLVAVKTSGGVFASWRIFGEEYYDVTYNLYRDGVKLNDTPLKVSNYVDGSGTLDSRYTVAAVVNGVEQEPSAAVAPWQRQYLEVPLQPVMSRSGADVTTEYTANDVSLGDLDGDGVSELLLKRINQADADKGYPVSGSNYTMLEAYRLDGTRLWYIDIGPNMVSGGSVEINFVAYDWDGDGKAEVLLRGADNMIIHYRGNDGKMHQQLIGSATYNSRGSVNHDDGNMAYTHEGAEYLIYLEGATGKPYPIGTNDSRPYIDYPLPRGNANDWGDGYGHRSSKYFFGAPFLDGRHASIFLARGIYTKHHFAAFDVNPEAHKLTKLWEWKSDGLPGSWYGQGNHNYMIADVDWDGRDEIVYGSMVIDDNGKGLSTTGLGHGDAIHCSDLDPYRHGQEVFACNESSPNNNYRDATTSKIYFREVSTRDDGRAMAGNFSNQWLGSQAVSGHSAGVISLTSDAIVSTDKGGITQNFRIYWDGDLCEESLDGDATEGNAVIWKYGRGSIFSSSGTKLCNWTKNTPSAQGDILGDWREELVLRTTDNMKLRIYTTTDYTPWRNYTLWHDHQYRQAMVWQMCGYNQPPHASYFLGQLEGITLAPPPLTMTGRTEIANGGAIGKEHDGTHVLLCETGDMTATLAEGAQPAILTDNAPTWVQGNNDNNNIARKSYSHNLAGHLSGQTRLVKQGDGSLYLNMGDHTHSGNTDIWAGTVNIVGSVPNSRVWVNRFATLVGDVDFGKSVTAEYGSTLIPRNDYVKCICPAGLSMDSLTLAFGARVRFRLFSSSLGCDSLIVRQVLTLRTTANTTTPAYTTPVFDFVPMEMMAEIEPSKLAPGRYPLVRVPKIEGDIKSIKLEGLSGANARLDYADGVLSLLVSGVRDAATVEWTGVEGTTWDFAQTANFLHGGESDVFVVGDNVRFTDRAQQFTVNLSGEIIADTVLFDNTESYILGGSGSLAGGSKLVKLGTGTLTVSGENSYTGGTRISGGTVRVSKLSNPYSETGNLGGIVTNSNLFIIENGATLQTTATVEMGSPMKLESIAGGIINNSADFVMDKAFTGTQLTKKGNGWLKLKTNSSSLNRLIVVSGTVEASCTTPAAVVEMQGGTLNFTGDSSTPIDVPAGKTATLNCYADRGTYSNRLTGAGTLTVYYPLVKGNGWNATRAAFNGDWSAFEGIVKPTGLSGDGRFCLNNAKGMPKGTFNIPSGIELQSTGKTYRIGAVTGSGRLGGSCSLSSSASGANTWQVGSLNADFEFGGTLTGSGTRFEKVGTGVMTLTSQGSDHTGTNTISEGTLCLNNSKATKPMLGTGALTVKSGAALTGVGSLASAVTISSGGLLRPGVKESSVSGTLDFGTQRVTVARGATLQFTISSQSLYTRLTGIADFVMNGHLIIAVREGISGLTVGREFQLWTAASSDVNPESLSLGALPEGLYWDITDLASSGILRITDDPELSVHPATVAPVVIRTEYYDLNGRPVSIEKGVKPRGIYIVRRHLSDGTVQVQKAKIN